MTSIKQLFHVFAVLVYSFSFWYDLSFVDLPFLRNANDFKFFKGRLKFLTIWNMLLQAVFFTVCVVNDLIGTNENEPKKVPLIRKVKDLILTSLAFPLSLFVGVAFWSIYLIDRELIFPRSLDAFFPTWLNHVMHTNIMIFILLEFFTSYRKYPPRKLGLTILTVFMLIYLIWIHIIHAYSGIWVYPVLEVLNFPLRIVFFALALVLIVSLYLFGEKLNGLIWNRRFNVSKKYKF